jgi:hypothetical protein
MSRVASETLMPIPPRRHRAASGSSDPSRRENTIANRLGLEPVPGQSGTCVQCGGVEP